MLSLNFYCQVSRNSADNRIKISSYTDFRFEIDSLSMHEQEKKYCFFILSLEKYLMIKNYKKLLVSVSKCFLLFLI